MFVDVYDAMQNRAMPILPGWRRLTLIWKKIMRCGTAIRTWRAILACRDTTISAKARQQKPCRMNRAPTAKWQLIFSFIPRKRIATLSKASLESAAVDCGTALHSASLRRLLLPWPVRDCDKRREFRLSPDYYKGDRSMRESGFDVSFRFGPFGAATHHYAPVCLNSLLYKTEKDMEQISRWLGHDADAAKWNQRAEKRKQLITRYLWDDRPDSSSITTSLRAAILLPLRHDFLSLVGGAATAGASQAVVKNLADFESPADLAMSTEDSGAQWDLPYGWGNIEMLAIDGLRRYGYQHRRRPDVLRISVDGGRKFPP